MANETPTLGKVIQDAIHKGLIDTHVAYPGKVVKYDEGKQKANIKPLLKRKYIATEDIVDLPVIQNVPVQWPSSNAGKAYIHLPLTVGDIGLIIFADRSIDAWKSGDGQGFEPDDIRKHDLSDGIFIPGINPFKKALKGVSLTDLIIQNDKLRIEIDPNGKIGIKNDTLELIAVLDKLIDDLVSATVVTMLGASPFTAATVTKLQERKTELATFLKS